MIRTATADEIGALRELFARANDAPYDLAAVAEEKCFGTGIAGAPVVKVFEHNGRIEGAAVTCGKWLRILAVDREHRRRGIGTALLHDSAATVIAAEPGNYFTPGVDESLRGFFEKRGYVEAAATWNLDVATSNQQPTTVTRAKHADADRILTFIEQHFGRIWRFEAAKAFEREQPPLFVVEDAGELAGFAAHDVNNRGLGWFGPTGVAKALRGRGLGCQLLLASLADLHSMGYPRAVIPWTDALAFYDRCSGAKPAYRFIAFTKPEP